VIKLLIRKIRLLSNARKEPYLLLYKILGFYPDNINYYLLAFSHRSLSVHDEKGHPLSNERLEFLGDAVLNSVITDILYHKYKNESEGFLTKTRSKIVKREMLNKVAYDLGIDKLVKISKSANTNLGKNLFGNAFEALMGAIYLDLGYRKCKKFFEHQVLDRLIDIDQIAKYEENFKSRLIEWCQKRHQFAEFVLEKDELINPNKHIFHSQLIIDGMHISNGKGSNRKESEQDASYNALQIINSNDGELLNQ